MLITLLIATLAAPAQAQRADPLCFSETGQCIAGPMLAAWERFGGVDTLGLPITAAQLATVENQPVTVQWFERARLELPTDASPENARLGRVGAELLAAQGRPWIATSYGAPHTGCRHFPETGYSLCGPFLRAWEARGGLAVLGLPITNPRTESINGHLRTVQWLERGRLEVHPELGPEMVQLGLVGAELLAAPAPTSGLSARDGRITFESNAGVDRSLFPGADPYTASYIHMIGPTGYERQALTRNHMQRDEAPALSPDGRRIAFHSPRAGGLPEIYVMDADGANLTRLTSNTAADGFPTWSPDGSRIAFASERTGDWEIYVMGTDGSGQTNLTRNPGATDTRPTWSPDGSMIAFRSTTFGHDDEIWLMGADGSGQTNLSRSPNASEESPAWSPDGRSVAFESNRDGNREIYLADIAGGQARNLTQHPAGDYAPDWSPNGAWLVFESDRDGNREVYVMRADGSGLANLTRSPLTDERQPQWGATPTPAIDPCVDVPEPISARVTPARCVAEGQGISVQIFGFLAGSRFEYRVTDPTGTRSPPLTGGHVDERGELAGIQFPAGTLTPGQWRFEFTFFTEQGPFYGATTYVRVGS